MRIHAVGIVTSLILAASAAAQEPTSLMRSEVATIKDKLEAVVAAMGGQPAGYVREDEDSFYLPTEFNPNTSQAGLYWPITSSAQMRFTDQSIADSVSNAEAAAASFQARYTAALASGNFAAIEKLTEEMVQIQTAATAAALSTDKKEDITANVQFNMNPSTGIDPDAVVLERPGVIALRARDDAAGKMGTVTVYIDPVALKQTEELSSILLRTDNNGVSNRIGLFHIVITLRGGLADIESWVEGFDYPAILGLFDAR
jgi:hypothetical protein